MKDIIIAVFGVVLIILGFYAMSFGFSVPPSFSLFFIGLIITVLGGIILILYGSNIDFSDLKALSKGTDTTKSSKDDSNKDKESKKSPQAPHKIEPVPSKEDKFKIKNLVKDKKDMESSDISSGTDKSKVAHKPVSDMEKPILPKASEDTKVGMESSSKPKKIMPIRAKKESNETEKVKDEAKEIKPLRKPDEESKTDNENLDANMASGMNQNNAINQDNSAEFKSIINRFKNESDTETSTKKSYNNVHQTTSIPNDASKGKITPNPVPKESSPKKDRSIKFPFKRKGSLDKKMDKEDEESYVKNRLNRLKDDTLKSASDIEVLIEDRLDAFKGTLNQIKSDSKDPNIIWSFDANEVQETMKDIILKANESLIIMYPWIRNIDVGALKKFMETDSKMILQEASLDDDASVELIKLLMDNNVDIKTMPHVHTVAVVSDDANGLIISTDPIYESFDVGVIYKDQESIEEINKMFEEAWELSQEINLS